MSRLPRGRALAIAALSAFALAAVPAAAKTDTTAKTTKPEKSTTKGTGRKAH
jgi:hypothetical protein